MQLRPKGVILISFKIQGGGGGGGYGDPSSFKEGHLVLQKNHTLRKIRWCKCITTVIGNTGKYAKNAFFAFLPYFHPPLKFFKQRTTIDDKI